jgi:hypothetical protein
LATQRMELSIELDKSTQGFRKNWSSVGDILEEAEAKLKKLGVGTPSIRDFQRKEKRATAKGEPTENAAE